MQASTTSTALAFTAALVFIVSRVLKFAMGLKAVNYLPGRRIAFWPLSMLGAMLPTNWWNMGRRFTWLNKFAAYREFNNENFSVVSWLSGHSGIYTSNLEVARQVGGGYRTGFIKPTPLALHAWGMNILDASGETWRKHRRIIGPTFNADLYKLMWAQTSRMYRDMIDAEGWKVMDTVDVPVAQKLTSKLSLLVLCNCAFGLSFNWPSPAKLPGSSMSLLEALHIVLDSPLLANGPRWLYKLPLKWIQERRDAHDRLRRFMQDQVSDRKQALGGSADALQAMQGIDIFSKLVIANQAENPKLRLSDEELIGNVFTLLFVGHASIGDTLAATLGFMALYPNLQAEVVQQIAEIVGLDRNPTTEDYSKLTKVIAVVYETIRIFPAGYVMIREALEDTILTLPNPVGEEGSKTIPISKGTWVISTQFSDVSRELTLMLKVIVDMVGIQNNPRYFEEPERFKPSRWEGVSNESEAFNAFSFGPRACLGRKFMMMESVCWLTMLLRDWHVELLLQPGETKEMWRDRMMHAKVDVSLRASDVPVRFIRRKLASV